MAQVIFVRPYGPHIRLRVVALLQQAGLAAEEPHFIAKGTPDAAVVEALRNQRPAVLVVPFHAHRDDRGEEVNGLLTAQVLEDALPHLRAVPIIMPVSQAALAAVQLKLRPEGSQALAEALQSRILVVAEALLDAPETLDAVKRHVRSTP